jgi:HSP20 family protein
MRRRYGYLWSPWQEMGRLQRDMNRLFPETAGGSLRGAPAFPAMNVWTSKDGAILTAELPGVKPDDIDISVVGDTLTLLGTRQAEEAGEETTYHRRERGVGKFTRSFQLPFHVDSGKVEASFDKGVLHVSLPYAEEDKPKKISVKSA